MSFVDIVDLLAVILDVALVTVYFHIFLEKLALKKQWCILIYLLSTALYYCTSVYLPSAYQRTIGAVIVHIILSMVWQGSFLFRILLSVFYVSMAAMIEMIVAFILTMVNYNIYRITEGSMGYILGVVLSNILVVIVLACLWFLWKKKLSKNISVQKLGTSEWNNLFLVLVIVTLTLSYSLDYLTIKQGMENGLMYFVLLECILLIFDIAIFLIFQKMGRLQQEKIQSALILQQNEAQQAFYKESIEKNRQLKKLVHDEKNFLLGVVGYLKHNKVEQAIAELEQQVDQLVSNVTDYTGNIALDTVLSAKVDKARQHGITLRPAMALYGEIHVDFLDLVLILGNALDNAIEAASQVEAERRIIHLSMKLQDDFLLLEVRNPVLEHIAIQENHIATSKIDTALHGYGLDTMKRLTEKYHGSLQLACEGMEFTVKILLEN